MRKHKEPFFSHFLYGMTENQTPSSLMDRNNPTVAVSLENARSLGSEQLGGYWF